MRATWWVLALVLAVGVMGLAGDGSVAGPIHDSGTMGQPMGELCPPGTVYHCERVCASWHSAPSLLCVNSCQALFWPWCTVCLSECIERCPVVTLCQWYSTQCACLVSIPYGLDPVPF
jgi:hypothetical protein